MKGTNYSIEITYESKQADYIPLDARSDSQAIKQLGQWRKTNTVSQGANIFLAFSRASDGQHGYINPDGAAPTGRKWN